VLWLAVIVMGIMTGLVAFLLADDVQRGE